MVKKAITVKLSVEHLDVLKTIGGNTKGIETLIEEHIKAIPEDMTPEEAFFSSIYLPRDKNMRATYNAYLTTYIKKGVRAESIGRSMESIIGNTGFDDPTIRKHFRKLVSVGFVKMMDGMMFRPTIRLRDGDGNSPEHFTSILEDYTAFIRGSDNYVDFLGDDDEL